MRRVMWLLLAIILTVLLVALALWLVARRTRGAEIATDIAVPIAVVAIAVALIAWLRPRPAPAARPTPARLEVVNQTSGWFKTNSIVWLTPFDLSRELWGRPESDFSNFLRRRRNVVEHLARSELDIRGHLAAVLRLVPDYSKYPGPYGPPERSGVGILAATVSLLIKVRNLGTESGGIMLRSSGERILRPPVLEALGAWVVYGVQTDESRHIVAPGNPVDIEATIRLECARTGSSEIPLDTSHAVAVARISRAFASFLSGIIEGTEVEALLDGGHHTRTALAIDMRAAADRCAVQEIDVDELERHAAVLDRAIDQYTQDELGKSGSD
jgi:hypothetical protein